ncbi:MAG: hypothetical protein ABH828_01435 [archaeon]
MTCYTIPATAAIIHFFMRKNIKLFRFSKYHLWLNQLLVGGAVFGVVDHWWNGELLLFGENIVSDLLLGITITIAIFFIAGIMMLVDKASVKNSVKIEN